MNQKEKLDSIDAEFKKMYGEKFVDDGISNIELFSKAKHRILWVLKEAVSDGGFSLKELVNGGVKCKPDWDWRPTYDALIKVSYSILNDIKDYSAIPDSGSIMYDTLPCIAVINIKKVGGSSEADNDAIKGYYKKDKELLLKQIEAIDPTIIINASYVWELFEDLVTKTCVNEDKFSVSTFSKGIVLNVYHPAQMTITHKKYFETIWKCLDANK
jgi:hypothetical protein